MEQYKEGQPVIEMQRDDEGRGAWLKLLIPQRGYFITPILIYLNFLVFAIMVITGVHFMEPESVDLINWGATNRVLVLQGDYWRLLSSCFVHIGIIHLLLNMYALLMIGALLERLLGNWRFLIAYLVTGIAASVTSICWHENSAGAGASGAIFGMYGLFLALLTTNLIERNARKELLSSIGLFVVYNLVFGLKGGIDNAAHIGGLVSGMVFGYAITPALRKPDNSALGRALSIGACIFILGISAFALTKIPDDMVRFNSKMDLYSRNEELALQPLRELSDEPTEAEIKVIERNGLSLWDENLVIMDEIRELKLEESLMKRMEMVREYTLHRIEYFELLPKALRENKQELFDELEIINNKIAADLAELEATGNGK